MRKFLRNIIGRIEKKNAQVDAAESGSPERVDPFLRPGHRLYCIGDIHGRLDLLEELHEMIRSDSADFGGSKTVVYLGDYIDRGAQSSMVLDLLAAQPLPGFEAVHLMGNHEQVMLDFLSQPMDAVAWLSFGGKSTLLSYGVGLGKPVLPQNANLLRDELEQKLPQKHFDFISNCREFYVQGSYCFVHAGIRPGIPMEDQVAEDLFWIREEFTRSRDCHEHIVVHGHTISPEVVNRPNRIGIDTGAYETGLLTALVLEGRDQRLLQTDK